MEKKSKKSILIGITSLFLVTLILLGLTYAYYRTRIIGNTANTSLSVVSKKLEVKYSDDNAVITASNIAPGYTVSKEFTVTNTGDGTVNFSVVLDNIENTFTRKEDWTFILSDSNGNEIASGEVPSSKTWIKNSIAIASEATNTYTLTLNYANLSSVDQSEDMGKDLSLRINIEDEMGSILEAAEEGTLLAAIGRDNLISEPLTVPGQEVSLVTEYGEGDLIKMPYKISFDTTVESYEDSIEEYWIYGTGYVYDAETNTYTLTGVNVCYYRTCVESLVGKYLVSTNAVDNSRDTEEEAKKISTTNLKEIYQVSSASLSNGINYYEKITKGIKGEKVLSITEDDYGPSYYFRGIVDNNYVNYSGMCWRIVRVLGNGTIKLVLADENGECNASTYSVSNGSSAFIDGSTTLSYASSWSVSYENSRIPGFLTNWATNNSLNMSQLNTEAEWCHDTSYNSIIEYEGESCSLEGEGYFCGYRYYGSYNRLKNADNASPTLKCNQVGNSDESVSTKIISGIGILSADEAVFAGFAWNVASDSYLKDNANWINWTISPYHHIGYLGEGAMFVIDYNHLYYNLEAQAMDPWSLAFGGTYNYNENMILDGAISYLKASVRPAIVLKSDVMATGTGTQSDPYVIS